MNLWELHKPDTHMSPCHDPKRYEYFRPEFQDLERLNYWGVHVEKTIVSTFNKLAPSTMSLHLEELRTLHIHTNIQLELFVDKFGTACIYNVCTLLLFFTRFFVDFCCIIAHKNSLSTYRDSLFVFSRKLCSNSRSRLNTKI